MSITKAIIPVAGWGTRRLPITKAIEKCMLPIGNRPAVDFIVQDCVDAGITDIYFVVGEQSSQLHDYYRTNVDLNDYLRRIGKTDLIEQIRPPKVSMHYIVQSSYGKYGTAIPVSLAFRELADGEAALVVGGDDFIYNPGGESQIKRLIAAADEAGGAIFGAEVPHEQTSRYGVLGMNDRGEFTHIVEKPAPEEAPSNLINISQYALPYEALKIIYEFSKTEKDKEGEYYITDPINDFVSAGGRLKVVPIEGQYLDTGTLEGWLHANQVVLADAIHKD